MKDKDTQADKDTVDKGTRVDKGTQADKEDIKVVRTDENGEQEGIQLTENGQRLVDSDGKEYEVLWHRASEGSPWIKVREGKILRNVFK